MIDRFIRKKKPFAILRYTARMVGSTIESETYDLMYVKGKVKKAYKPLNQDVARSAIRKYKLPKVVETDCGVVYEFNGFKELITK